MDDFPHVATLSAEDCERVAFALRLVNLENFECICTDFDDPNDHREDCPHWGRNEAFFREEDFEKLADSIESQCAASRVVTALSPEAASWVVTALDKLAIQMRGESNEREYNFLTVIATLFSAAEQATREMPLPSRKDEEQVSIDPMERIADSFERIAVNSEVLAAEVTRRFEDERHRP